MTDYIKATNFASKDTLPVGNANKKIKGTEIDIELNAISSSVATKADINSPVLTGTPLAPTATASTNTTQIATTAMVQSALAQSGVIGTTQIADDAVTSEKLADDLALPGNPTTTTQAVSDDSTKIATTAFVQSAIAENVNTSGAEQADAATDSISVVYGPTGSALVLAAAGRKALFGNYGTVNFALQKGATTVRSESGEVAEAENRDSDSTFVFFYTQTGQTPGSSETWTITSSGKGTHTYTTIAYIGF